MLDLLKFLDARLSESGTWASLAALLGLVHVSIAPGAWADITLYGTGVAVALGVLLKEAGTRPAGAIAADVLTTLGQAIATALTVKATPAPTPDNPAPGAAAGGGEAKAAIILLCGLSLLGLGACTQQQAQTATSIAQAALPNVLSLGQLAAAHSTTVAGLVTNGALFCKKADGTVTAVATADAMAGPLVGALNPYAAMAVTVIGAGANVVSSVCAAVEKAAVPVPAPDNVPLASVPVAAVPAAAALKPAA